MPEFGRSASFQHLMTPSFIPALFWSRGCLVLGSTGPLPEIVLGLIYSPILVFVVYEIGILDSSHCQYTREALGTSAFFCPDVIFQSLPQTLPSIFFCFQSKAIVVNPACY